MYQFSRCKHENYIPLRGGKLYGQPGATHQETVAKYDLNVFLSDLMFPEETPFVMGLPGPETKLKIICYSLRDQQAPDDNQMLEWLLTTIEEVLIDGGSVAVSCQGGHGRTGTILALLFGRANPGCQDPVKAVREIICKEEVESWRQIEFIFDYFKLPNPYPKPIPVVNVQQDFSGIVNANTGKYLPHENALDDWVKEWTDPVWRLNCAKADGPGYLSLDCTPEEIFELENGEDIYTNDDGHDVPVICIWEKEGEEQVLVGGIIRYLCPRCCGDMALTDDEKGFRCLGVKCGLERALPVEWKKLPLVKPGVAQ